MPVAYSYIRFSSQDQIKGDSLRRQTEASASYAASHGLTLDGTLKVRDLGVSAFKGKNFEAGALGQFILAIDEGRVAPDSYLLVESLDRLSRLPVTEALAIFQTIISRGITIVTLTDGAVYSKERLKDDWTPLLIALVTMSRAHEESALKSRRVKAALAAKKNEIKEGKLVTGKIHWWLKFSADKSKFEVVEENAATVRLMFNLAKDGLGASTIAKYLNERKIPTAGQAKLWGASTVKYHLQNIGVIGVRQLDQDSSGRTTTNTFVEDYYPAIIDKTLFYEVKAFRATKKRTKDNSSAGRTGMSYNMFQGLVKCGYCGSSVYFRRRPGFDFGHLYCANSLVGGGCVGTSYGLKQLESEFLRFTRELDAAHLLGGTSIAESVAGKKSELAACVGELADLEFKLGNLLTAMEVASDVLALVQRVRELEESVNELRKRRLALQAEIEIASNVNSSDQTSADNIARLMAKLAGEDGETDEKYRLRFRLNSEIRKVVAKIVLFPGGGAVLTPTRIEQMVKDLREIGYDDERIAEHVATLPTKPDRDARYFVAHLHNGNLRTVIGGLDTMLETMPPPPPKFTDAIRARIEIIRRSDATEKSSLT